MNIWKLTFSFLVLANTFSCATSLNPAPEKSEKTQIVNTQNNGTLTIETSPDMYAPIMSSTVGILLKPVLADINNYKLVFKTEKGMFLSWNNQVKDLGKEAIYDGTNIYWSYDSNDKFNDAEIKIDVLNKNNSEIIQTKSIKIKIDDKGFASVLNNNPVKTGNSNTTTDNTPQTAFKGMELYSWKEGDKQFFSLLEGTNRLKRKDEITNAKMDFNSLLEKVKGLPEGETIIFVIEPIYEELGSAQLNDEMKKELKNISDNKKITLNIS